MIAPLQGLMRRFAKFTNGPPKSLASLRNRRIMATALAGGLSRALSISTALISVPLTLGYLGAERFGMWMTMSSLIAFLSFADLGIGNGLLSSVAAANGRDDRARIRSLVSSAFFALTLVAICVLALFAVVFPVVDWSGVFNVSSDIARAEAGPVAAVFVICFALAIPAGIVIRVQMGLQKGFIANLWQCASSVLALIGVLLAISMQASLPVLVLAYVGAPLLVTATNAILYFTTFARDIAPTPTLIAREPMRSIMAIGLLFLLLQIVGALTFLSDNIIIAQTLGAAAVADYAVPEKLFALISSVVMLALAPLWPAYGEAIARKDKDWVRQMLRRSMIVAGGVAAVCSTVMVFAAPYLVEVWVGSSVAPPMLLLVGFGLWKVIEVMGNSLAMFLNGARVVGFQVVASVLTAVAAVILKIYLIGEIGIAGAVWATIACYVIFVLVPFLLLSNSIFSKAFKT